jgi:glycosyltransferase involved in cell wall biosynthesis
MAALYSPHLLGIFQFEFKARQIVDKLIFPDQNKKNHSQFTSKKSIWILQEFGDEVNGITKNWESLIEKDFGDDVDVFWIVPAHSVRNRLENRLISLNCRHIVFPIEFAITMPQGDGYQCGFPQLAEFQKILNDYTPHLVHFATPTLTSQHLLRFFELNNVPCVAEYRTDLLAYANQFKTSFMIQFFIQFMLKKFFNKVNVIIFPSIHFANKSLNQLKLMPSKCRVVPRGLNRNVFFRKSLDCTMEPNWKNCAFKMCFIGRLSLEKNIRVIIRAWKEFIRKYPNSHLYFAGKGPLASELELFESNHIHLLGEVSSSEVATLISESHFLLFPSETETFGQVVLESISLGTPVIISQYGACHEIVKGCDIGFQMHPMQKLSDLMYQAVSLDWSQYLKMRDDAWRQSQNFSIEKSRLAYHKIWHEWSVIDEV